MSKRWGISEISVNGQKLDVHGDPTIDLGGEERTAVVGNEVYGHISKPKPAEVSCDITVAAGYSIEWLRNLTGATLTVLLDTGQTYLVNEAYTADTLSGSAGDPGKWSLKFMGAEARELV